MKTFIERFGGKILRTLHGFDRIRFRGTRRFLANVVGMMHFLWHRQVLLKDFKAFAGHITAEVRQAAEDSAIKQGRPIEYLHSSVMDKEAWARKLGQQDGITEGLIGVLKAVECCWSYEVGPNRAEKKLQLRGKPSKCLHYYHYFMNPEVGLVYVRLQTWSGLLNRLLNQANPVLGIIDPSQKKPYYWSMDEGEWASDLAFGSPKRWRSWRLVCFAMRG